MGFGFKGQGQCPEMHGIHWVSLDFSLKFCGSIPKVWPLLRYLLSRIFQALTSFSIGFLGLCL